MLSAQSRGPGSDRKGILGKKLHVCTDDDSIKKANYAILHQSSLVDPYI
jgi:hypothetical protein